VFSGECDSLTCVYGNDFASAKRFVSDCAGPASEVGVLTTEGTVYFILVHGFGTETGTFELTLTRVSPLVVSTRIESSLLEGVGCIR
jgi:hypothetical protein